jgi:glutamyl endopeptidase
MSDLTPFLREIAADPVLRRAFAASPSTVLRARGYDPAEFNVPERLDLNDLEARLQELAAEPSTAQAEQPTPRRLGGAEVGGNRRLRHHLGRRRFAAEAGPVGAGLLSEARAIPPFDDPPVSEAAPTTRDAGPTNDTERALKPTQDSGAAHPPAWFGSNGTAVSRALIAGDNAARLTPETVIGRDDRVQVEDTSAMPFRWICRLVIKASNGTLWSGTGWFIRPNLIVTAGHCVYMQNQGGWVQQIDVTVFGPRGQLIGPFQAQEVSSASNWVDSGDTENDYGIIVLPKGFEQAPGYFGFGEFPDNALQGAIANIAGFPIDKPPGTLWGNTRRLSQIQPNTLYYETDTYGGMSGAPVVCWNGRDYVAIGIHNYGDLSGNRATRINASVFANLETWIAESA